MLGILPHLQTDLGWSVAAGGSNSGGAPEDETAGGNGVSSPKYAAQQAYQQPG